MKKLFALLSVTAFLAVSAHAQSYQTTQEVKKDVTEVKSDVKSDAKTDVNSNTTKTKAAHSCCKSGSKMAKDCTPAQKAACAKAGMECDHAKAGKECNHSHAKSNDGAAKEEKAE
jgi:hypothetical protein